MINYKNGEFRDDQIDNTPRGDTAASLQSVDAIQGGRRLETENAGLRDCLLRAAAETENVRRRGQQAAEDASQFAISNFAREVLAVADSLRQAVSVAEKIDPDVSGRERAG